MGQYHIPVNLDKKEYIHPHRMGDGLKLLEFGCSSMGTMTGLAVLLHNSPNRGGGDLHVSRENPFFEYVCRWAGDRIVIAGDYAEQGDPGEPPHYADEDGHNQNLYRQAQGQPGEGYTDISFHVLGAMMADKWIRQDMKESRLGFDLQGSVKALLHIYEPLDNLERDLALLDHHEKWDQEKLDYTDKYKSMVQKAHTLVKKRLDKFLKA